MIRVLDKLVYSTGAIGNVKPEQLILFLAEIDTPLSDSKREKLLNFINLNIAKNRADAWEEGYEKGKSNAYISS
jgi:hypothetical protein